MANVKDTSLTAYYIGKETTYGVGVAPTRHIKETGATATLNQETVESQSRLGSRWASGPIRVGEIGNLTMPVEYDADNLQVLLKLLTGNEVVTGSADPWTHTFTPQNVQTLPSASLTYLLAGYLKRRAVGAVLNTLSFEIAPKSIVTGSAELVYKTESDQHLSFAASAINVSTDEITITAHGLANNDKVKIFRDGAATFPGGLENGKEYYVVNATANTIKLSLTSGGPAIDLTGSPSGNFILVKQETLSPTNETPFTYSHASVKFDGVSFGELRQASLTFSNNLKTDDFRFNLQGQLYAITAGKFSATGSLVIVFNEDSRTELAKVKNQTETDLEITLDKGLSPNRKLTISLPKVRYSSYSWGEGDLLLNVDLVGVTDPPTFTLLNGVSNAF